MIENRNGTYGLACYYCGTRTDIEQVAHRDGKDCVVGYLFLCGKCLSIIGGNYCVTLSEIQTGRAKPSSRPFKAVEGETENI